MANREGKKIKTLEVSIMFEPSRMAEICIAQAYERVVPITRRVIGSTLSQRHIKGDKNKRRVGGAQ